MICKMARVIYIILMLKGKNFYWSFPLGSERWPDKSKYEGRYLEGKKHGKGIFSWPDGSSYEGEFKNNNIEGYGKKKI
jgi:hypothetical protein